MKWLRDSAFYLCTLWLGAASFGVFLIILVSGAAYVYENSKPILYLELFLSLGFTVWAIKHLIRG